METDGTPKKNLSGYTSLLRLLSLSLITLSLWYSVGVGVSMHVHDIVYVIVDAWIIGLTQICCRRI